MLVTVGMTVLLVILMVPIVCGMSVVMVIVMAIMKVIVMFDMLVTVGMTTMLVTVISMMRKNLELVSYCVILQRMVMKHLLRKVRYTSS